MSETALLYHNGVRRGLKSARTKGLLNVCIYLFALCLPATGQVIEFLSNGLKYQALTRDGLTLMYAPLPLTVRDFAVVQVAFNNGSGHDWLIQPVDFYYETTDGKVLQAVSEYTVIYELYRHAGRSEVIKLQSAYEKSIYNNQHIRSNNGYEQRRQSAMAMGGHKGIKAAAAASAIALVRTQLRAGDSTDGAIFFLNNGKKLGPGKLLAKVAAAPENQTGEASEEDWLSADARRTTFQFPAR